MPLPHPRPPPPNPLISLLRQQLTDIRLELGIIQKTSRDRLVLLHPVDEQPFERFEKDITKVFQRVDHRWVEQIQPLELLSPPSIPQPLDRVFLRYAEHIQETALDTPPTVPNPLDRVLLRYVERSQKTLLGPPPDAPDILDRIYLGHVEHGRKLSLRFPIGLVEARPPYWQVYLPVVLASW